MPISLDYSFMVDPPVAGGVAEAALAEAAATFGRAMQGMQRRRAAGELGFLDLPANTSLLASSENIAARFNGKIDDVVVLGIGGSALGTVALRSALLRPLWNLLPAEARAGRPRLHVLDNIDPSTVAATLELVRLDRTLFMVASKSGGTAETMAQYLIVRDRLNGAPEIDAAQHLVFVTDPERGALRAIAADEGIAALQVPPNVGGRFSVLSPVGVLPALLTGMDVKGLLGGAQAMLRRCEDADMWRNPAGVHALLQWLSHTTRGRGIHVLMPYGDALRDCAAWFVQLWAESLGKVNRRGEHSGPTPIAALGASDQHSQVQLFMEGPMDKTVTFISVPRPGAGVIPAIAGSGPDLSYLSGHSLGELLDAECEATRAALAARGRPSMTITMPVVDAYHLGELFMFFQVATVLAGELYDVNPMDQPGVELGKQFTYALMGRPGSEMARREWESLPRASSGRRV